MPDGNSKEQPTSGGTGVTVNKNDGSVVATGVFGEKSDYDKWGWKEIMARITGAGAISQQARDKLDVGAVSNPETLWNAATAIRMAKEVLASVGKSINDQTKALAGEGGPWQGEAATAFVGMMKPFAESFASHATQLDGGPARLNPIPEQLWAAGNYLQWAIKTIHDIDNFYAQEALRIASLKNPPEDITMESEEGNRIHVGKYPEVVKLLDRDMRVVLKSLAGEYEKQDYKVDLVTVSMPGGVDGPNDPTKYGPVETNGITLKGPDAPNLKPPPEYKAPEYKAPEYEVPEYNPNQYNPNQFDPSDFKQSSNPNEYNPNEFDPNQFKQSSNPNEYNPNQYNPNQYNPNQFSPNTFNPNQYSPNQFNPNEFKQNQFNPNQFKQQQHSANPNQGGPGSGNPGDYKPGEFKPGNPNPVEMPDIRDWKAGNESPNGGGSDQKGLGLGNGMQPMMPPMAPMSPSGSSNASERSDASGLLGGESAPWEGVNPPGVGDPAGGSTESTPQEWAAGKKEQAQAPGVPVSPPGTANGPAAPGLATEDTGQSGHLDDRVAVVAPADGNEDFSAWNVAAGSLAWLATSTRPQEGERERTPESPDYTLRETTAWGHTSGRTGAVHPGDEPDMIHIDTSALIPKHIPPESTHSCSGTEFTEEELAAAERDEEQEEQEQQEERTSADLLRQDNAAWEGSGSKAPPGVIE
ncbi:hypothetical protein ALI144C_33180 [Actinosynnema sp. ALI-1.44]|uniref:WXG100 family type VII secretion target n=1 Tax=Actinosynnema sp. ALI-1.44 TaxID=1933779 RepID=UPI00097C7B9A|nr:WXG100 family type VII secretion target [Actinosynnema sp. ALI-1.44]ONI76975.1 hypothetical protein ALI144C_33180 [Actinosynnema sp. ALI-1.44]